MPRMPSNPPISQGKCLGASEPKPSPLLPWSVFENSFPPSVCPLCGIVDPDSVRVAHTPPSSEPNPHKLWRAWQKAMANGIAFYLIMHSSHTEAHFDSHGVAHPALPSAQSRAGYVPAISVGFSPLGNCPKGRFPRCCHRGWLPRECCSRWRGAPPAASGFG